jgi:hypothetical protein
MIVKTRTRRGLGRLGITSALVDGSLIVGSPTVRSISTYVRAPESIGPRRRTPAGPASTASPTVVGPAQPSSGWGGGSWGGNPNPEGFGGSQYGYGGSQYGSQYGYGSGYSSNSPTAENNLAQLTLLYQSNPASLTAQQWQQLQAAGVIPSTVPYADASLTDSSSSDAALLAQEEAAAAAVTPTAAASSSSVLGVDPTNGATTIFGVDWYYVAAFGVFAAYLMTRKH